MCHACADCLLRWPVQRLALVCSPGVHGAAGWRSSAQSCGRHVLDQGVLVHYSLPLSSCMPLCQPHTALAALFGAAVQDKDGKVIGARWQDNVSGKHHSVYAKQVGCSEVVLCIACRSIGSVQIRNTTAAAHEEDESRSSRVLLKVGSCLQYIDAIICMLHHLHCPEIQMNIGSMTAALHSDCALHIERLASLRNCGKLHRPLVDKSCAAVQIINATGPFVDQVRQLSDDRCAKMIMPSAGVHITLPDYYSPQHLGMIVPKTQDGRVVFMLPWLEATIAGTTGMSCSKATLACGCYAPPMHPLHARALKELFAMFNIL